MRFVPSILASAVALGSFVLSATASAQEASPDGKGIAGGALLGAELVLVIEAAADVQSTWAYVGGGAAGAVAGGVGGYFVERESSARVPMLMLGIGMAFAIPTTVAVLSATAYEPPADFVQDQQPPTDEPIADPPRPATAPPSPQGTRRSAPRVAERRAVPPALIDVAPAQVSLSVPAVAFYEVFSKAEVAELGVAQATEVRIPVLNVVF